MNYVRLDISEEDYKTIPESIRAKCEIVVVEPKEFDYSYDETWKQLKSNSTKAYKALKEREFKIRQDLL